MRPAILTLLHTPRQWLLWIATAAGLAAMTQTATAASFIHGCAARDWQLLMLIEHQENILPAEDLDAALLSLLDARIVCHQGKVMDALAIYDQIARSIAPGKAASARPLPEEIP